jgi:hypothetical protein
MRLILERICGHDEIVNVHGSLKYREILGQLLYCWVVKHGSLPWLSATSKGNQYEVAFFISIRCFFFAIH